MTLGAVSTRPGAEMIDEEEELKRIIRPLQLLVKEFPEAIFSIDTFRSNVARECIHSGAHIINDVSGGNLDDQNVRNDCGIKGALYFDAYAWNP